MQKCGPLQLGGSLTWTFKDQALKNLIPIPYSLYPRWIFNGNLGIIFLWKMPQIAQGLGTEGCGDTGEATDHEEI